MTNKKNFPLRIDSKLYDILQGWAKDEFRSVNSHVEFLLREAVEKAGRLPKNEDKKIEED
ncbi:toxin-antitoxin system HicB family antitoxin [Virgibacillus byunsanensis]|uniref:Toxin-antitoxin system HicB family antitoxin n=1 Tax=Virgibacillus byunsanensis TaxID=570945 RepID=A0ABW3LNZ8_9BACI